MCHLIIDKHMNTDTASQTFTVQKNKTMQDEIIQPTQIHRP